MITYRIATVEDVPEIRKVIRSSIENLASKDYSPEIIQSWGVDNEASRTKQIEAIRNGIELTWVAVQRSKIIGFSAIALKTAELRAVYVSAEVVRHKVGTKLLELVESEAKKLGIKELTMHSSLTAKSFYEYHGYKDLGDVMHTLSTGVQMRSIKMSKFI